MSALRVFPVAASSPFDKTAFELGVKKLQAMGFSVTIPDEPLLSPPTAIPYLNGADAQRLDTLRSALTSQDNDIVWLIRGGYGLTRILADLKLEPGSVAHKTLVGFSDGSALLAWAHKTGGVRAIHGPSITRLPEESPDSIKALHIMISGRTAGFKYPPLQQNGFERAGPISGKLLPFNLAVLTTLIGTSLMPDLSNGLLILEEINEDAYSIDRMLTHLKASSSLAGVKAIITGHFTHCRAKDGYDAMAVFRERCDAFRIPLCSGLAVGHETPNWAVPYGADATLFDDNQHLSLRIDRDLAWS